MDFFEGTKEEYLEAAKQFKKKNNSLSGFTEQFGFFKENGSTFKIRVKEGGRLSLASTASYGKYQEKRAKAEKPKTPEEAQALTQLKRKAKEESESTLHQMVSGGKPSIVEHDVRLASGGSNEFISISDPEFKVFKDTVESKAYSKLGDSVIVDIDDVSGDVRLIPSKFHNKYQPTSLQPGIDVPVGTDIDKAIDQFKAYSSTLTAEKLDPATGAPKAFDFSNGSVRLNAKNLAIAGLVSYGAFGTAASAAETTQRTQLAQQTGDPLDVLQAGIAGVSTAADVAAYNPVISPAAEVVSTVADVANVGIDTARNIDIGNELKYIGGQVRLGKLPYGLQDVLGMINAAI